MTAMRRLPVRLAAAFLLWTAFEWPLDAAFRRWLPDIVVVYPSVREGEVPPNTDIRVDLRRPMAGALFLLGVPLVLAAQRRAVRADRTAWMLALAMMCLGFIHFLFFQCGPWTFALLEGFGLPLSAVPWYFNPLRWNPYRFLEVPVALALLLLIRSTVVPAARELSPDATTAGS